MSDYGFIEHDQDPAEGPGPKIAPANVGKMGAISEKKPWMKWAVLGALLLAMTVIFLATRGPSYAVTPNGDGTKTFTVKSQRWRTQLPAGWDAGKGGDGIVLYPGKYRSADEAMKQKEYVKVVWGDGTAAAEDFKDEINKALKASARQSVLRVGSGTRAANATRIDDVNGGSAVYIDHDPSLAISTLKTTPEFEEIIKNLLFV